MREEYREATSKMEEMGVDSDYIIGWQGGYLGHPKREEQRLSQAYETGYEDGAERNTENFKNWVAK